MTEGILHNSNESTKLNIETRISGRAKSIFAAFGTIVNDFYLEAGIYFVGGFNAALVAWDIYTDLLADKQPLLYAVAMGCVAFIAVEGLAVYLVGAAAKTNNGLLWFFSVIFAGALTFAHYQELMNNSGLIAQYITLAIPFFVVIGYWARTVKIDIETTQTQTAQQRDNEIARQRRLEDDELAHKREIELLKLEQKQAQKMVQIEAQTARKTVHLAEMNGSKVHLTRANQSRQDRKLNRQNAIIDLMNDTPDIGPTGLARELNELGYDASVSTIKRDIKAMNGRLK